jgi:hypothetical protein
MVKSINASAKRRGRPVTTGTGTTIGVRMLDDPLAALDAWIAKQKEPDLTRPEAIRRLVEIGLTVKTRPKQPSPKRAERAKEVAAKLLAQLVDQSAPAEEQESRKRRLLKGPEEFRDVRVDLKAKGK